jgi:thiosulfate/3-mercaptopyruvate sulfurtransferase
MSTTSSDLLVTADWLHRHLGDPTVKIIDGSWHMPAAGRDAQAEYAREHIPGAVFFDIDAIADQQTDLPHMLPTPDAFAEAVGALGISDSDTIVVYDTAGIFSAPRVWWTFRIMGAKDVRVLNGGLPAWKAADFATTDKPSSPEAANFTPDFDATMVRSCADMQALTGQRDSCILDARPAGRFEGTAPEPRPGLPSGHMPGATNLPASELIEDGFFKSTDALSELFASRGVTKETPVTTTCGSGVTAAILAFGLYLIGHERISLYDGSWTEWASHEDTEIISR